MAHIATRDRESVVPNVMSRCFSPPSWRASSSPCSRVSRIFAGNLRLPGGSNENQRGDANEPRARRKRRNGVMIAHLRAGLTPINLLMVAALLLTASPWLAGFSHDATIAGNAVLCGLLILSFALAALLQLRDWRSWMSLTPGVWVLLSPWILDFATHVAATAVHMIIGLVVSLLAVIDLCNTETLCLED